MRRSNKEMREHIEYSGYVAWKEEVKEEAEWEALRKKDQPMKEKK